MAQQIAIRPRLKETPVAFFGFFPCGEGDGAVGIAAFDLRNQAGKKIVRIIGVFAALQHKRAESQAIALPAAVQYFFFAEAVPGSLTVVPADAAVKAVVFAVAGKLNQAADKDGVAVVCLGRPPGFGKQVFLLRAICD